MVEDRRNEIYSEELCGILCRMIWKYQMTQPATSYGVRNGCATNELQKKGAPQWIFFVGVHIVSRLLFVLLEVADD